MAHVILGGLFTSTFLNMLVVPTFFAKWRWETDESFARQTVSPERRWFERGAPASELGLAGPTVTLAEYHSARVTWLRATGRVR